jgi:hypothetical protein
VEHNFGVPMQFPAPSQWSPVVHLLSSSQGVVAGRKVVEAQAPGQQQRGGGLILAGYCSAGRHYFHVEQARVTASAHPIAHLWDCAGHPPTDTGRRAEANVGEECYRQVNAEVYPSLGSCKLWFGFNRMPLKAGRRITVCKP